MTYGALAKIRGITRPSAERLARRMKWSRLGGNDGFARVLVPLAFIEPAGDKGKDGPREGQGEPPVFLMHQLHSRPPWSPCAKPMRGRLPP